MEPQTQNPYRANDIIIPWLVLALTLLVVGCFIAYFLHQEHANIETRAGMVVLHNPLVEVVERDVADHHDDWRREAFILCGLFGTFGFSLAMGLYHYQCRQRAFQQLTIQNERFLRTLTDVIPGMVGYWNRDMRCTFANKEYWTWFGKSPDEMLGIQIQDLLGEEQFREYEHFVQRALKGEVQRFQRSITKINGEVGHTWAHYIPDIDGDQVRGFYVVASDITELKQTQLQLEELNEALKQRTEEVEQAFRSKSKFMSTVAHEFRTPLSLLVSSIDILDRYGMRLTKERRAEQNGHIRSAARQMSNLIDSVLSFNCLETDRPSNSPILLDAGQVCRAIAAEVKSVWGAGYEFDIMINPDCGTVMLDEILFRRVLENLLTNAFRYTPEGGTVSLHVNRDNNSLRMVVTDSGIGISEEDQNRIFEAFYRGRNVEARRGLGLGLSIVREALLHMGGNIMFTSRIGEGTSMHVEIPVTGAQSSGDPLCTQFW